MLRCAGEVVRYERKPWTMEGRSGISRRARVSTMRGEFVDVTIPEDFPEPRDGDYVDWAVIPGVSNGKVSVRVSALWPSSEAA